MHGKRVVLGVCGGISAYKAAELTRVLVKTGNDVRVIMTKNAREFITPLTMQTLSRNKVCLGTFDLSSDYSVNHIGIAEFAEVLVIAPATANFLAKVANGIADDLLSTVALSITAPLLLCPAMNDKMLANPVVQENIARLVKRGASVMDTGFGELACNSLGSGRMAEVEDIVLAMEKILTPQNLHGINILVSAGPTRESIDPVRFISNHSTGKMGFAVARAAQKRGADVTLVSGPSGEKAPMGVKLVCVSSALEMQEAMLKHFPAADIVVKAAAVADYRPKSVAENKIKKSSQTLSIPLELNPDILAELGAWKGNKFLIGFAMETEDLLANAKKKLAAKNLDIVVANSLREEGAGFAGDTNVAKIVLADGAVEDLPLMGKAELANIILDRALSLRARALTKKDG